MPIVDPRTPTPKLRMELFSLSYMLDPLPVLHEPHVFVTLRRDEDDALSVKLGAAHAIHSGGLLCVPTQSPNFVTAALAAAYSHRGAYKGSRSRLCGFPTHVPVRACFVFRDTALRGTVPQDAALQDTAQPTPTAPASQLPTLPAARYVPRA